MHGKHTDSFVRWKLAATLMSVRTDKGKTIFCQEVLAERCALKGDGFCRVQVHHLISELNDITAAEEGPVLPDGAWREKLGDNSRGLFNSFPRAIQEMLLLERDPHGNVQVGGKVLNLFSLKFCQMGFGGWMFGRVGFDW